MPRLLELTSNDTGGSCASRATTSPLRPKVASRPIAFKGLRLRMVTGPTLAGASANSNARAAPPAPKTAPGAPQTTRTARGAAAPRATAAGEERVRGRGETAG